MDTKSVNLLTIFFIFSITPFQDGEHIPVIHVYEDIGIAASDNAQLVEAFEKAVPEIKAIRKPPPPKAPGSKKPKKEPLVALVHAAELLLAAFIPRECAYGGFGTQATHALYFFQRREEAMKGNESSTTEHRFLLMY